MKRLIIEIREDGEELPICGFDVVDDDGRRCDGLNWGEMLEQVAALTIPQTRVGKGYPMHTTDEWQRRHDERATRRNQSTPTKENPQ